MTAIEWTDRTWNPSTGCDRVSPGCDNCYAMNLAKRLKAMGSVKYQNDGNPRTSGPGFGVTFHEDAIDEVPSGPKPQMVFVNSMSDLFHAEIADHEIAKVFAAMHRQPQHRFQILTKRHARMRSLVSGDLYDLMVRELSDEDGRVDQRITWPLPNVWLGVSVENQQWADLRIPPLLDTPAAVRFLSCEPLLGRVDLTPCHCQAGATSGCARHNFGSLTDTQLNARSIHFPGIDWVIAGGESGARARPMHPDWAGSLRDQCAAAGVPFLFKQWGNWAPLGGGDVRLGDVCLSVDGTRYDVDRDYICAPNESEGAWLRRMTKKAAGRTLDGELHDEYPLRKEPSRS